MISYSICETMSDHSAISISFKFTPTINGPGLRKLNTSLLKDREYVRSLSEKIKLGELQQQEMENRNLARDYMNYKIRFTMFTMKYSKKKKKNEMRLNKH